MLRRNFLASLAAPALAQASLPDRIPIGYNTYCLRGLKMTDRQHFDQAIAWNLDALFLQDSLDPATNDPAHWADIKTWAKESKLHIETGGSGILPKTPDQFNAVVATLRRNIARAKACGSPIVRSLFASFRNELPLPDIEANMELGIKVLRTVRQEVLDANLKIAIEVHKDFQAWEHKIIIEQAGKDFVGTYLDTGNPVFTLEDPLLTLETLAPYVLTFHLRDSVVYNHPDGIAVQWVPLGEGTIDFKQIIARARQLLNPSVHIFIKPITGRAPAILPVYDDAWWARWYPKARAQEYARFLAIAKRGRPYEKTVVQEDAPGRPTPPVYQAALAYQQKEHMERSIRYARQELNLGVRS
ncbi:sugar phosphate isomerase/epimerase family protein [Bryobacter aggregatus]|uniref:sugar phosphate isomerase/epimerase family protein n=1 Tax=Bryobacter aggregatus TaxID=360054 RepID=UPI0004E133A7|nr:TIM barrel protein [Bryobacter aggregatus]